MGHSVPFTITLMRRQLPRPTTARGTSARGRRGSSCVVIDRGLGGGFLARRSLVCGGTTRTGLFCRHLALFGGIHLSLGPARRLALVAAFTWIWFPCSTHGRRLLPGRASTAHARTRSGRKVDARTFSLSLLSCVLVCCLFVVCLLFVLFWFFYVLACLLLFCCCCDFGHTQHEN